MHSYSILVWVAVLCSTSVVSYKMNKLEKSELADKLNVLVQHSGWQFMNDIKISLKKRGEIVDPIPEILKAISLNQKPVDESNVMERQREIWTVLMCKYGDIIFYYKVLIQNLIMVCQNERNKSNSLQVYYDCFDLLLEKLYSMSLRYKCMTDALVFLYSQVPKWQPKHSIMVAAETLAEYTFTLRPTTLSKLFEHGTNVVDVEMIAIGDHIQDVYRKSVAGFLFNHCHGPGDRIWSPNFLLQDFMHASANQLISEETTMLQYVESKIDSYVDETFTKWFYNLGFQYDEMGNITIRLN